MIRFVRIGRRRLRKVLIRMASRGQRDAGLGRSLSPELLGSPGPILAQVLAPLEPVPGWFNVDDCGHFHLVMRLQSALGVSGDLLEIGSYHGRSTALMAHCLAPGEKIVVCDAFEAATEDPYSQRPSPEQLRENIARVSPELQADRVIIHRCLSSDLVLDSGEQFRFVRVDGGHADHQVFDDLSLCFSHLLPGGVIAVDDYNHPDWPGVTSGTDRFMHANPDIFVLADLNRHGARGRKLYLMKRPLRA